jgi:hypothetical protein
MVLDAAARHRRKAPDDTVGEVQPGAAEVARIKVRRRPAPGAAHELRRQELLRSGVGEQQRQRTGADGPAGIESREVGAACADALLHLCGCVQGGDIETGSVQVERGADVPTEDHIVLERI